MTTQDKRTTTHNRRLTKKRVQCLNEALYFVSSSMLAVSLVLLNPLLRQAPKRYASFWGNILHIEILCLNKKIEL